MMCDRASIISNNRRKCREHDEKIVKREIFYVETYSNRTCCAELSDNEECCVKEHGNKEECESDYETSCQCENCLRSYHYLNNTL